MVTIRVIDLETTGLEPPECIIEAGWTDVFFDPPTKIASVGLPRSMLFQATGPISAANRAVHHIKDSELVRAPVLTDDMLKMICRGDEDEVFALCAANCAFERQWLTDEICTTPAEGEKQAIRRHWICTIKATHRIYPDLESKSNQATRYALNLDLADDLAMPPHRAGPDSFVTANILAHMLKTERVSTLIGWTQAPLYLPKCPIGKHKGQRWEEIPPDYLSWILRQEDMSADIKHAAQAEVTRRG